MQAVLPPENVADVPVVTNLRTGSLDCAWALLDEAAKRSNHRVLRFSACVDTINCQVEHRAKSSQLTGKRS
jgi:hypothetical protein